LRFAEVVFFRLKLSFSASMMLMTLEGGSGVAGASIVCPAALRFTSLRRASPGRICVPRPGLVSVPYAGKPHAQALESGEWRHLSNDDLTALKGMVTRLKRRSGVSNEKKP
jgi:hypothetical protein